VIGQFLLSFTITLMYVYVNVESA